MRKVDPEQHAARRETLLAAAAALFAERGYDATRTADICKAAGMSTGNLFHYFPTKHDVLLGVAERDRERTAARMAGLADAPDPRAALLDAIEGFCRLAADRHVAGLAFEMWAQAHRDPGLAAVFRTTDRETRETFAAAVRAGIDRGALDSALDPDSAATWLCALVEGFFARVASDPGFDPDAEIATARRLADGLLRGA